MVDRFCSVCAVAVIVVINGRYDWFVHWLGSFTVARVHIRVSSARDRVNPSISFFCYDYRSLKPVVSRGKF